MKERELSFASNLISEMFILVSGFIFSFDIKSIEAWKRRAEAKKRQRRWKSCWWRWHLSNYNFSLSLSVTLSPLHLPAVQRVGSSSYPSLQSGAPSHKYCMDIQCPSPGHRNGSYGWHASGKRKKKWGKRTQWKISLNKYGAPFYIIPTPVPYT